MHLIIDNQKINILEYKSFFKKLIGLMNKKDKLTFGVRLNNCSSVHTFFMKQNIDICITDKENKILYIKENISKNKIIFPVKNGYYTYELPLFSTSKLSVNKKLGIKR